MAEQALPAARMAGPETEREILEALAWARRLRGRPLDDLCDRFEAIGGASVSIFRSPARARAELLASRGEVTEARAVLEPLLAEADERGETLSYAFVRLQSCELELRVGEWGAAEARLDEWAESLDRDVIDPEALFRCRAVLEIGRGDAEAAGRWAATAVGDAEAGKHVWSWLEGLRARAGAALLAGRPADAVTDLRTVWLHCLREGVEDPAAFPVAPDLVEALIETAGFDEATQVVKRLDQLAHDQDHPWATATSGRARGLLALGRAKHDEGTEAMRQAAALYGDLGLLFDRARTLLSLGRAQRRDKRWAGARNVLRDAAAAFDEIGSTGWAIVARGELARVAGRKPGAPGDLTPSERRVADLAAEGRSNKEIAQALFVSVDTVETHLSHVYGKLGVESRIQLSRRLAQADSLVAD